MGWGQPPTRDSQVIRYPANHKLRLRCVQANYKFRRSIRGLKQDSLRAAGEVDDGLEWKDEYAMDCRGSLTGDYTVCMSEGTRRGRTRRGAFPNKPPSDHKNLFYFFKLLCYRCPVEPNPPSPRTESGKTSTIFQST